ncbi:hypothetical protein B7463_g7147, partial [Scytalidium lignicola]
MVHQSMVSRRKSHANRCREQPKSKDEPITITRMGVFGLKVPGNETLTSQEEDGREKMRIDIHGFIVQVQPASKATIRRLRFGPVAVQDELAVLIPFGDVIV